MSDLNVIAHNLTSVFTANNLNITGKRKTDSIEKLSSGYKINRAADDAAGLTISEKMRSQIRGLTQASLNAQDGISMVQTIDGALEEVHSMLQRCNELAIKAANGTLCKADRDAIDDELQQIFDEIDRCAETSEFNTKKLFPSDGLIPTVSTSSIVASSWDALAEHISQELVPNVVNQILSKFDSLKNVIDNKYIGSESDKLKMPLDIQGDDGVNGTLAYVTHWNTFPEQNLSRMSLSVDMNDFNDDSIDSEKLESTIAHEMMHAVMAAAIPARMYTNDSVEDLPKWFIEGTAQLTGGGFPTNWNSELEQIVKGLNSEQDNSRDEDITDYLSEYTVENRVYGHGYLASAYLGYLANGGSGNVDASSISSGMNKVFQRLIDHPEESFESAINNVLSAVSEKRLQDIIDGINGEGSNVADATEFVRKLCYNSKGGAGSVIASGGLNTGGSDIIGSSESSSKIYIDPDKIKVPAAINESGKTVDGSDPDFLISLQVGAASGQEIAVKLFSVNSNALGLKDISYKNSQANNGDIDKAILANSEAAKQSISIFQEAISRVSYVRSYYGAVQNRLEHTIANLDNVVENTTAAESRIRDTDMASEIVKFSKENILEQAGQSILAQANHQKDGILNLLG